MFGQHRQPLLVGFRGNRSPNEDDNNKTPIHIIINFTRSIFWFGVVFFFFAHRKKKRFTWLRARKAGRTWTVFWLPEQRKPIKRHAASRGTSDRKVSNYFSTRIGKKLYGVVLWSCDSLVFIQARQERESCDDEFQAHCVPVVTGAPSVDTFEDLSTANYREANFKRDFHYSTKCTMSCRSTFLCYYSRALYKKGATLIRGSSSSSSGGSTHPHGRPAGTQLYNILLTVLAAGAAGRIYIIKCELVIPPLRLSYEHCIMCAAHLYKRTARHLLKKSKLVSACIAIPWFVIITLIIVRSSSRSLPPTPLYCTTWKNFLLLLLLWFVPFTCCRFTMPRHCRLA